ncbi:MAG: ABC transporter permease [Sporichthyaceae bacterium]
MTEQNPSIASTAGARAATRTSWSGVRTVAAHEFRVRIRTGRWRALLYLWFAVLAVLTALIYAAVQAEDSVDNLGYEGVPTFGGLMLLLLGLSLIVVPALTAQSVNGDRERGVLAGLQVSLLTPTETALGKLLAAWGTALVFLLVATPLVVATLFMGGVSVGKALVCLLVVAALLASICAIAQALSAVLARTVTSAVLSYVVVFGLGVGTVVVFALATPLTETSETYTYTSPAVDEQGRAIPGQTQQGSYTTTETHPERIWWLLAPNPFVVLADAAPSSPPRRDRLGNQIGDPLDPLGELGQEIRRTRNPNWDPYSTTLAGDMAEPVGGGGVDGSFVASLEDRDEEPAAVWPWGLAFHALLTVGAVSVTIRRLRAPTGSLPRGVRIA